MCYEEGLLRRWASKKTQRVEDTKRVIEHAPKAPQPVRPTFATETKRPKEVETELEIV